MSDVRFLLERSTRSVPGPEFNRVAFELRGARPDRAGYEVVLDPDRSIEDLAKDLVPKLRAHLRAKRQVSAENLLVWLWLDDRAHLFDAKDLLARLATYLPNPPLLPGQN